MSAAVVDRDRGGGEARIGERADGDAHARVFATFLGVEHGRAADRAEPERESGPLIADANVLGGGPGHGVRRGEAGQRRKDTARSTLTGEAVADADAAWFALHFDAQ